MKTIIKGFFIAVILAGCAAPYKPTAKMLHHQKTMNKQSALSYYTNYLFPVKDKTTICNTLGMSFDNKHNMKVTVDGMHFMAYRAGEKLETKKDSLGRTLIHYKKEYYQKDVAFADIGRIEIYSKNAFYHGDGECFQAKDYKGPLKDRNDKVFLFWHGMTERFQVRVHEKDIDRFAAAVTHLMPKAKMTLVKDR